MSSKDQFELTKNDILSRNEATENIQDYKDGVDDSTEH